MFDTNTQAPPKSSVGTIGQTLFLICLGHFLVDFTFGVWPVFKTIRELDLAKAGMIAGLAGCLGEGMQLIFGALSDRGFRKPLLIFGAIAAASNSLLSYFDSYEAYLAIYILTCTGSGAFHPTAAALLARTTQHRKGFFIGLFGSIGALGMATSQLAYSKIYFGLSGHTAVLLIPSLIFAYFVLKYPISNESFYAGNGKKNPFLLKEFFRFFKNKDLRHLYFSQLCNQIFFWGFVFLLPDFLSLRLYPEWISLGGGHMCLILGAAVALIPAGWFADKITARLVIFFASLLTCIFLVILLGVPALSEFGVLSVLFILGAGLGSINPMSVALGNQYMPDKPATISAFLMGFVWVVSELLGAPLSGYLTGLFVNDAPAKSLACTGLFLLIALYHAWYLPIVHSEKKPEEVITC